MVGQWDIISLTSLFLSSHFGCDQSHCYSFTCDPSHSHAILLIHMRSFSPTATCQTFKVLLHDSDPYTSWEWPTCEDWSSIWEKKETDGTRFLQWNIPFFVFFLEKIHRPIALLLFSCCTLSLSLFVWSFFAVALRMRAFLYHSFICGRSYLSLAVTVQTFVTTPFFVSGLVFGEKRNRRYPRCNRPQKM